MPSAIANPLLSLHQQANAEFQPYGDIEIVTTFGEPQAEYAAVRKSAGMMDAVHRGILELRGKDRLAFLNNLITNQVFDKSSKAPIAKGQGCYAFLLNAKTGRIEADMNVLEQGDRTFLETDARLVPAVSKTLEKHQFSEQVQFIDQTSALHTLALHGPGALAILAQLTSPPLQELAVLESRAVQILDVDVVLWRDDSCGVPGYSIILPADSANRMWSTLIERFGSSTELGKRVLRPIGWAVFNTTRIEAGRPLFGIDFDDSVLPAETGQMGRAVSLTKGCYPGQEIVARMHARQQVARQLVGIRLADDALPLAGAPVLDDLQNQIGGVTSSTISPILSNAAIGIALVKKQFVQPGTIVNVPAEGAIRRATVTSMPFVKPGS